MPRGHNDGVRTIELERLADELELDVVGAAPAGPYEETERLIGERRARGLFADMKFTMAQPEVSCHPERLLPGARTVISAALCYYAPAPEVRVGEGRLPRYTWSDHYAELREKLDALGRRLGGEYRVLVDENQHVDREAAARAGVGVLRQEHAADHQVVRLLGRARDARDAGRDRADAAPRARLRVVHPLRRRVPDGGIGRARHARLDEVPGVLDAVAATIPEEYRAEIGGMVYGCDICQDVCPWNRGIEKRRTGRQLHGNAEPTVSLVDWLEADGEELVTRYDRLYVPRNDPRYLKRNALIALGNTGGLEHEAAVKPFLEDPVLGDYACWARDRLARGRDA